MSRITLIRHAPTTSNDQDIFMGNLDVPITEKGLMASRRLGMTLLSTKFTAYYSSPLLRAKVTAEELFPSAQIILDSNLRERELGYWEGKSRITIRKEYPSAFYSTQNLDPFFTPPGGESIEKLITRISTFLYNTIAPSREDSIVIISHNTIIRLIRCMIELCPPQDVFTTAEPHLKPRTYTISGKWREQMYAYIEKFFTK